MTLPKRGKNFRNTALLFGVILFVWFPVEDFQTLPVVIFGTVLAFLLLAGWLLNKVGGKTISTRALFIGAMLAGALWGLGAVIGAAALMFFKTAAHGHVFPDYPPLQILAMLERAPVWTVAGGLLGLGLALLGLGLQGVRQAAKPADSVIES